MKRLFLYSSFTGNGEAVAQAFTNHGYDLRKVSEKKKMPKSFFWGMMVGGFRAGIGAKGKLVDYDPDVSSYDEVVIGSPIWNGAFPPVTNAILAQTNLEHKNVTFVIYSGSGEGKKAQKKVGKLFPNALCLFLKEPKKYPEQLDKLAVLFTEMK